MLLQTYATPPSSRGTSSSAAVAPLQPRNGSAASEGPYDSETASLLAELNAQHAASLAAEGSAAAGTSCSADGAPRQDGLDRYLSAGGHPLSRGRWVCGCSQPLVPQRLSRRCVRRSRRCG